MSHGEQMGFVRSVARNFPQHFFCSSVLEIGSYNINGSVRDCFLDCAYIGVDVAPGPGVDVVAPLGAAAWLWEQAAKGAPKIFDTIITAECLEHDIAWDRTLHAAQQFLRPGGLLVVTCAGKGRPEHGTRRTTPTDVPPGFPWPDYYRGLGPEDLRRALRLDEFERYEFAGCVNPSDTYFWGLKAGDGSA